MFCLLVGSDVDHQPPTYNNECSHHVEAACTIFSGSALVFDAQAAYLCVRQTDITHWSHVSARHLKRMWHGQTFQVKSRKRINDKCHRETMERLIGMELETDVRDSRGQRDKEYR